MGFTKTPTNINQKTGVDGMDLTKLHIGQNDPKEKQVDVTVINTTTDNRGRKGTRRNDRKTDDELNKANKRNQQEEEKYVMYQRADIGQLSEEEESHTESDYLESGYFK